MFEKGETFKYAIKKLGVTAGEATLEFKGEAEIYGKNALLIVFTSEGFNFYDQEEIYLDPETFYPIAVKRDLDIFGNKEQIEEKYDALTSSVTISKMVKGKLQELKIKKDLPLDNLYCFIYRLRNSARLKVGYSFDVVLPTADVKIEVKEKLEFKVMDKKFNTFFMQSVPKKYRIWFDDSEAMVPLRIDGAVGFGKTSMVLTEISHGGETK
ncbi:MAG: DUF3108 domain-containing protein [Candidatus Omnitrophica bacterium]|nr:DUF3108 domain-containing protein [Candidatus Omnitrophota bacterium]MBU1996085.1 DUF3108 domain-containing protein [Candidatus Omnitrophota bacterium]MBU4333440.1 DUF3108 domain-containing protein [Candidatus Omnitrophota bacterium]